MDESPFDQFIADLQAEIAWEDKFGDSGRESPWSRRDREAAESRVGSQVVGHGRGPYETLGNIAAEVRRMKADGVTRASIEYVLDQIYE